MLKIRPDLVVKLLLSICVFLGAALLFVIEPLIAKWILPWFGGGASVWTTCMLFFQVTLLLGYLYAHLTTRYLSARAEVLMHCLLLLAALATLPATPSANLMPVDASWPALRCLRVLVVSIGLPFFVLSTTGTLAQAWWIRLVPDSPPYRLYALSNLASLLGLLAYPFGLELLMGLRAQAWLWSGAMVLFVLVCGICAILTASRPAISAPHNAPPDARSRWRLVPWTLWPACSSLLLLSVTATLSQSVAPVPFLWVVPLVLYLLSFVICFEYPTIYRRDCTMVAFALSIAGVCVMFIRGPMNFTLLPQVAIYGSLLFTGCMICHGELYRLRPPPQRLSSFYLSIAFGGVVGSIAAAIAAPLLFSGIWELHLGIAAIGILAMVVLWISRDSSLRLGRPIIAWFIISLFATVAGAILWINATGMGLNHTVARYRSFYGALSVRTMTGRAENDLLALQHGGIIHGIEARAPDLQRLPLCYYWSDTGLGRLMRATQNRGRRIGIVGLGIGAISAWSTPDDRVIFYELNPQVTLVAKEHFSFISNAPCPLEIIEGDARISLERQSPQQFDVLVLDAFSGDSIPMHLLTREAMDIYKRHVKPGGAIIFHITNRHVDLEPVIARLAEHARWQDMLIRTKAPDGDRMLLSSDWAILTASEELFARPELSAAGIPAHIRGNIPLWTDDRSNLLQVLR